QVQGAGSPPQIIKALQHFNEMAEPPEVIVIVRGGGSADDLAAFNDEPLVRAIAASRVPTLVGVGHEVDTTLADLVADRRAATPSNAAQLLVPDKRELVTSLNHSVRRMIMLLQRRVDALQQVVDKVEDRMVLRISQRHSALKRQVSQYAIVLKQLDPRAALKRGYALVRLADGKLLHGRAEVATGEQLTIELDKQIIETEVRKTYAKKK
ncbi:exodeoxyribonuclease VII large subunit, partial [Candidatus Saccharibacteria bacterium]